METVLQIESRGAPLADHQRERIRSLVDELEKRFGRVTAGRVTVEAPGRHHETGGHYRVGIHLVLPDNKEIDVDHTPDADERFADVTFAINDAFRRARRQLNDQVRRMEGYVKTHEPEPLATVLRLDREGGFGFLQTPDGRELYFHRNSVLDGAFNRLEVGVRVGFAEEQGEKGPQASTVRIAGKHSLR